MSKHKHHQSPYKIGLSDTILFRSRIVFILLLLFALSSSGSAVYAGIKTGQLERVLVEPVKNIITDWQKQAAEEAEREKTAREINAFIATSSASINIKVETNLKIDTNNQPTTTQTQQKQSAPKYTTPTKTQSTGTNYQSYEDAVKAQQEKAQKEWAEALKRQEEWSQQKRLENQQWFEETTTKNAQDSKAWYDQQVKENRQRTEEWKKQHGF